MTIVLKRQGKIVVATGINDCCSCMTEKDLLLSENIPFWKIKEEDECYVGFRELSYSSDLLKYNNNIFRNITDFNSVAFNVVPNMKALLGKHNVSGDGMNWHNKLVIIKNEKIYEVDTFFNTGEENEYCVLTNFEDGYIKGALDETKNLSAEESVLQALRGYSLMYDTKVFPITLFNITGKKKKVYYK